MNGNIAAPPQFVDAANLDFHLAAGSAAIESGASAGAPRSDFDRRHRPLDGNLDGVRVPDIGAFEYAPPGAHTR